MKRLILILSVVFCFVGNLFATVADDFAAANQAYSQKDFGRAISSYETLLRRGETHPEIYYNLGLAYEESANPARAVLSFERAMLLSPGMEDAQHHLDTLTGENTSVWEKKIPRFGADVSVIVGVTSIWLILIFLVARWRMLGGTRTFWSICVILSFFALTASVASFYYRDLPLVSPDRAVILKSDKLRSNFTDSSPTILAVRPGQTVEIKSVNGPWTQVLLPDQTRGWLPSEILERVLPK